eukprot:482882-Rhodomonas_salina.1
MHDSDGEFKKLRPFTLTDVPPQVGPFEGSVDMGSSVAADHTQRKGHWRKHAGYAETARMHVPSHMCDTSHTQNAQSKPSQLRVP